MEIISSDYISSIPNDTRLSSKSIIRVKSINTNTNIMISLLITENKRINTSNKEIKSNGESTRVEEETIIPILSRNKESRTARKMLKTPETIPIKYFKYTDIKTIKKITKKLTCPIPIPKLIKLIIIKGLIENLRKANMLIRVIKLKEIMRIRLVEKAKRVGRQVR